MAKKKTARKKAKKAPAKKVSRSSKEKGVSRTLAIVALLLNLFTFGLGNIIAGKVKEGIWQMAIFILGGAIVTLTWNYNILVTIGSAASFAAWLWSMITSIKLIQTGR